MKIIFKILLLTIGLSLFGCEDVIHVDLDTAEPRLVIDASIDWVKNTSGNEQKIKLSTTTGYYEEDFPIVSGAVVSITNSANTTFDFIEVPDTGEYVCSNFEPAIDEEYTLNIELDGETYTATETLTAVPDIEDTVVQNNEGGFDGDEIEITYYYQDDGEPENYYLYGFTTPYIAFPNYKVMDNRYTQGNLIPILYFDEDLEPGDLINFKLYGISKRYYHYLEKLLQASGDNPFPTTPAEIRGNIVNTTHGENYTFGYFRLSQVDSKDYLIE